MIPFEHSVT